MTNYFRIVAYWPKNDLTILLDSNGAFERKWQFSAFLIERGFKIIEVSDDEHFIDITTTKVDEISDKMFLRARQTGMPTYTSIDRDGTTYKAVNVADKVYIP